MKYQVGDVVRVIADSRLTCCAGKVGKITAVNRGETYPYRVLRTDIEDEHSHSFHANELEGVDLCH